MANGNQAKPGVQGLQIQGGAAIVAPASAFQQNAIPANALIVVPIKEPTDELKDKLEKGPLAIKPEQMWELLGFNGPAVQVMDDQGRPLAIGRDDLLSGLEKHWQEDANDLTRARVYAQELLKHANVDGKHLELLKKAEQVLSKLVAKGGSGDDWLALGITQLQQDKLDKAEGTLKGASNLLKTNAYPPLHLARLYAKKDETDNAKEYVDKALEIDPGCVDAWAFLFQTVRDAEDEDAAIAALEAKAKGKKNAAPFIAIQGFFAAKAETRDKAIEYAKKAVDANSDDPIGLLCLSALYGQKGDLKAVVELLSQHETKMSQNVHLANNYFEALFQTRQIDKVTKLLNSLVGSPNKEVKQFAVQRSQLVGQFLQQQQQRLAASGKA
jgi:tetratricopeptide (TPR) repeat protein